MGCMTLRGWRLGVAVGLGVLGLGSEASAQCTVPSGLPGAVAVARDLRVTSRQQRARALLTTEIHSLESLRDLTPTTSPDRVQILRRLAEDNVELENGALKEAADAQARGDASRAADMAALASQARAKAVGQYTEINGTNPNYPQLDETRYYLAYEYERDGDAATARKMYFSLITSNPNSKYIPYAYLSFGELFFKEARSDPAKWELARQAYEKVISYPPPNNGVYGYAWFKLAHVLWHLGESASSVSAFEKAKAWGRTFTQDPSAASVSSAASGDLAVLRSTCASLAP